MGSALTQETQHPSSSKPPFEQARIPDKDYGLKATVHISEGTCVLAEQPLFSLEDEHRVHEVIKGHVEAMDEPTLEWYRELTSHVGPICMSATEVSSGQAWKDLPENVQHLSSVFWSNHIDYRIFAQATRINHACRPNLFYAWNPDTGLGSFHATRDINEGEELTRSYFRIESTDVEKRQDFLRSNYGFQCTCEACTDDVAIPAQERAGPRLTEIYKHLEQQASDMAYADMAKCKEWGCEMLDLLQHKPSMECMWAYRMTAMFFWYLGQPNNALQWMKHEKRMQITCVGLDHPKIGHCKSILRSLETAINDKDKCREAKSTLSLRALDELYRKSPKNQGSELEADSAASVASPTRDWRLENCAKASWWARLEMEEAARKQANPNHVAVEKLAEHAEYMQRLADSAGDSSSSMEPYADIDSWLEHTPDETELRHKTIADMTVEAILAKKERTDRKRDRSLRFAARNLDNDDEWSPESSPRLVHAAPADQ